MQGSPFGSLHTPHISLQSCQHNSLAQPAMRTTIHWHAHSILYNQHPVLSHLSCSTQLRRQGWRCRRLVISAAKPDGAAKRDQIKQAAKKHAASSGGASSQPGKGQIGKNGSGQQKPAKTKAKIPDAKHVTPLMEVMVEEHLTPLDPTIQPLWASFCGHTNGVWQGRVAALFAATGEAEPVYMEGKAPCYDLHTLTVEERPEDDRICRKVLRSPKLSAVRNATLAVAGEADSAADDSAAGRAASASGASTSGRGFGGNAKQSEDQWQEDMLVENEDGLVFFDGGTFSRGPHWLLDQQPAGDDSPRSDREQLERQILLQANADTRSESELSDMGSNREDNGIPQSANDIDLESSIEAAEEDEIEEFARKTSVIEQCLAWGGEQRLRCQLTLSVGAEEGELDVEVLRLLLWRESWQGLAQECFADRCLAGSSAEASDGGFPLSLAGRSGVKAFEGRWKVFDVSAVPIDDTDPLTGESSKIAMYFSQETRQRWRSGGGGGGGGGDNGAAIWLPNQVLLELRMIEPSSRGVVGDADESMDEEGGRGFMVGFSWAVKEDTVIGVHREYDGQGELLEVRSQTAVRGSWVGGQM